ncbi:hypothetical protein ACIBLB_05140 [Streptosporangium canum]|uniref:hypothetical protein n=1 Tax=Streptosporangium canum TaxID=324952 RepID=UPI003792B106
MLWRFRIWWVLAFVIPVCGFAYMWAQPARGFGMFGYIQMCRGYEFHDAVMPSLWSVTAWVPVLWYMGLPVVVLSFVASLAAGWCERPRWGRVTSRVMAMLLLAAYGIAPAAFAVDMLIDRGCLRTWGGHEGVEIFVLPNVAPTLAALCLLLAVRRRRERRGRLVRRTAVVLAPACLLLFLPAADLSPGRLTSAAECGPAPSSAGRARETGDRAFLCAVRRTTQKPFSRMPDRELLAYGHHLCGVHIRADEAEIARLWERSGVTVHAVAGALMTICPSLVATVRTQEEARKLESVVREVEERRMCAEAPRHRPLVPPVKVSRKRLWTDYGVLESYEGAEDPFEDDLLDITQKNGLVATLPGHAMVRVHSDYLTCATAETYRRRPPVETRGWDHVVEVGYHSPGGELALGDAMGGSRLPNLAFLGKGDYRIRVHYHAPHWEDASDDPQQLLIMVFPGRDSRTVVHRERVRR